MKKRVLACLMVLTLMGSMLPQAAAIEESRSGETVLTVGGTDGFQTIQEALDSLSGDQVGMVSILLESDANNGGDIEIPTDHGITEVTITSATGDDPQVLAQRGRLFANGIPLTIEHGTFGASSRIVGGSYNEAVNSTDLTILGGVFDGANVNGGNYVDQRGVQAEVTGTARLTLSGDLGEFNIITAGTYASLPTSGSGSTDVSIGDTDLSIENASFTFDLMFGGSYLNGADMLGEIGTATSLVKNSELTAYSGFVGGSMTRGAYDFKLEAGETQLSANIGVVDVTLRNTEAVGCDITAGYGQYDAEADIGSVNVRLLEGSSAVGVYGGFYEGTFTPHYGSVMILLEDSSLDPEGVLSPCGVMYQGGRLDEPQDQMCLTVDQAEVTLSGTVSSGGVLAPAGISEAHSSITPEQTVKEARYLIQGAVSLTLYGPVDSMDVESPEGYRITSCTVNDKEKMDPTGSVELTNLKAGDRILTEMEPFQALDVVYISDNGDDANNSGDSPEEPVKTWEQAYSLLADGGTIVVVGKSTAPSAKINSTAPMEGKCATITGSYGSVSGGTLIPTANGMTNGLSFGADTTLENLTINCSQNPNKYGTFSFYANGHDLTIGDGMEMIPFPKSAYPYPIIFAGGSNKGQPANSNTLIVKSGRYTEISTNEVDVSSSGASLYLYGGVTVDYVNSEHGTGGEIHIKEGSEAQPTVIGNIYLTYEDEVGLDSLCIYDGGYLSLIGVTAAVQDLTIQAGGVLKFEHPSMDDVSFGSLTGGGTLILPSGACLTVTGPVTGDTSLRILPGAGSGDGYVDGIALGIYVTAAAESTGSFILENQIKAALKKEAVADGCRWTLVQACSVTFDSQGGSTVKTQYVVPGESAVRPADPTWNGHDFDGWYLDGALYDFSRPVNSDITLTAHWKTTSTGGSGDDHSGTSGGGSQESDPYLRFDSNGGTKFDPIDGHGKDFRINVYDDDEYGSHIPTRPGHRFTGWYRDRKLTMRVGEDELLQVRSAITLFAGWADASVPGMLNGDDHYAYIQGYSDGSVRPNDNITRAQVATIFFRLLDEDVREDYLTADNAFQDVSGDYWANTAISTMASLGIINGRDSGNFDPEAPITRAEFAAICARFDDSAATGVSTFTDTSGHWAEAEISRVAALGWVQGYTNGSFCPDAPITRAQAVTMINRVLCRLPESAEDLLPGMNTWSDCHEDDWFYLAIQEATNSHDFTAKDRTYETWTGMNADPDWSQYE